VRDRRARCGAGSLNLAGMTTLPELAAVLANCRLALTNDSGGMHLAAAMGIPVTAVFGITDQARPARWVRPRGLCRPVHTGAVISGEILPKHAQVCSELPRTGGRGGNGVGK